MKCQGIFDEPHHVTVQIDNEFDNNETTKKKSKKKSCMSGLLWTNRWPRPNLFHIEKCLKIPKGVNRNTYVYALQKKIL